MQRKDRPRSSSESPRSKGTRKDGPSSNSLPQELGATCDWHGTGNIDPNNVELIDCCYAERTQSDEYGNWHNHIDAVLFWKKKHWPAAILDTFKPRLRDGRGRIFLHRSGSANNRMFLFQCKKCFAGAAVYYPPWKQTNNQTKVEAELFEVFDFLKLHRPERRVA